ncbi:hypothetical protein AX17_000325 [Amanita inopinata Kibby_2008]|nr:hypothetical protein AX17_000325 [Amanita inopinata Kibby_2008]
MSVTNNLPPSSRTRPRPQRLPSVSSNDDDGTTPTSLASVISAFQSAGTRRRAMTSGSEDVEYERERKHELENENLRQQRIREKAPGRRPTGKTKVGDIDAVLDQVKDGWEFVIDPDFNSVDLALQLLDESSQGKDVKSFRQTKEMLSRALKGSVDKYYQAFATSLPHHASLSNRLSTVQGQVSDARMSLLEAKETLGNKRADLVQLWSRDHILEEMIRLLDQLEYLKSVPDLLETLISEKRLLQASVLLVKSMKVINKSDMLEIGAVSDLRSYLNSQETALRDILIDELQSHLYLKSFWCECRWTAYVPNQQVFPAVEYDIAEIKSDGRPQTSPSIPTVHHSKLNRFMSDLALRPNDPPHGLEEANSRNGRASIVPASFITIPGPAPSNTLNPEADSFAYMETLVESLAVLGKLGTALDTISQRLPGEIHTLVETTLNEVEERAEFGRTGPTLLQRSKGLYVLANGEALYDIDCNVAENKPLIKSSCLRLATLESSTKQTDHDILRDLFWTLYSKLDAVVQGFRVVSEVANRVGSRRDFKDSSGTKPGTFFPLDEVWVPIQTEVHNLIRDYLTDEDRGSPSGRHSILSINEALREGKVVRDKSKMVFRLADTDLKLVSKSLKPFEDGLTRVLKETMPGLVPGTADTIHASLTSTGTNDERILGGDQHHRLLIRPDAFHVTVLFQPTLSLLNRIADILPAGTESARASSSVLDDFVLRVYLPQLEEKVSDLFHQAVTGADAFQPDPFSHRFSREPVTQASTKLMSLINSLCAMLCTSPFHRENYSRLILSVIIQFYQRCSDRYQDLVSKAKETGATLGSELLRSAQWSQRSEITSCLAELLLEDDSGKQKRLCLQETHIELELLDQVPIDQSDLMPTTRNIAELAVLHHSVSWFASELQALRAKSGVVLAQPPTGFEPTSATTPYTPDMHVMPPPISTDELHLPLSREMTLRYQALLKTYEQLSGLILDTIRIEIRCRTIFDIESSMRHGLYALEGEASEPDPYIMDLNQELGQCNDLIIKSLPERERHYIFVGLGSLMEDLLIRNACLLQMPNTFGIRKVMRHILALQQSLRTWTTQQDGHFERAKQYYSLFFISPQDMLDGIRKQQNFSFDEYQTMLNLQCGVDPSNKSRAQATNDRNYSMYVIDLHGIEMEKAGG